MSSIDLKIQAGGELRLLQRNSEKSPIFTLLLPEDSTGKKLDQLIEAQLLQVFDSRQLRAERAHEIVHELSMSPAYWANIVGKPLHNMPHVLEFMSAALQLATQVVMQFKHAVALPRPSQLSSQIQPIISVPGHGALPSGHSTQFHMVARLMSALHGAHNRGAASTEQVTGLLFRRAERVANNRTIAGVHYPMDSMAGCILGDTLANFLLAACSPADYHHGTFDMTPLLDNGHIGFHVDSYLNNSSPQYAKGTRCELNFRAPVLMWLWDKANAEWSARS